MNTLFKVLVCVLATAGIAQAKSSAGVKHYWKAEYFPTPEDILNRPSGRPFTITVEGNVGSGKSTFLNFFRGYPDISVYQEPVDYWTTFNGTDLLGLVYNDTKRWGLTFQSLVSLTMLETQLKDFRKDGVVTPSIKLVERSIQSGRYCFVNQMTDTITSAEKNLLVEWYDVLRNSTDINVDAIIYLRTDPKVVYERVYKRNRSEELRTPLSYFQDLHRLHEDWLIHKNVTQDLPRVIVIDANEDLSLLKLNYRQVAKDIFSGIPEVLKTNEFFNFCTGKC